MSQNQLPYGRDRDVYYANAHHRSLLELTETERVLNSVERGKPTRLVQLRQRAGAALIALGSKLMEDSAPAAEPLVLREECA